MTYLVSLQEYHFNLQNTKSVTVPAIRSYRQLCHIVKFNIRQISKV